MTAATRPSGGRLYVLIAVLMTLSVGVQAARDQRWSPFVPPNPTLWLQSGSAASKLALGFDNLIADVYWMRAVVYYGGRLITNRAAETANASPNFDLLYPLLDLVTSLDPHFKVAYRFGAIFLTEGYPAGPGRPDLAVKLLQRGLEYDAGRWEYAHDIGFIYYWWLRDYQQASDWFLKASELPGAATWLKPLAATTLAGGGNAESSRRLWSELRKSDVEFIRAQADLRLLQLDAMDTIAALTPVLQRFMSREGRPPKSWEELARAEGLGAVPTDPTGKRFYFDPQVGRIDVSPQSALWPLPTVPAASDGPLK